MLTRINSRRYSEGKKHEEVIQGEGHHRRLDYNRFNNSLSKKK